MTPHARMNHSAPVAARLRTRRSRLSVGTGLFVAALAVTAFAQDSRPAETQPATQPSTQPTTEPASRPAGDRREGRGRRRGPRPDTQPATSSAPASGPSSQASSKPTTGTSTSATSQPATKDRYLAVINGRVHTVTGPVLEKATVLSKNGVITAIAEHVQLPPECEVVEAGGLDVYPGLVAAASGGIFGSGEPRDSTNVYGINMLVCLAGGITTGFSDNGAHKMAFGEPQDIPLKQNLYLQLSYSRRAPLERAQLRADLDRVRNYLREVQRYERDKVTNKDAKAPDKEWLRDKYETYRKLLAHELVATVSAGETQDLRDIAELAQQYDFRVVIRGAYEGWAVAPALGRAGAMAVITPREVRDPDLDFNRPTGSSIETAKILRDHGVTLAVIPQTPGISFMGLAGQDLLHLNMHAAFTVRGGLSNDDALRTITIDAARVLGVEDRVGSLEVGKDADLVVCDGDLLHYMTQVRYTIVSGRVAYDKAKSTLFAHIRPTGNKKEAATFDDAWPKRLAWPPEDGDKVKK